MSLRYPMVTNRYTAFVGVIVLSALSPAVPHHPAPNGVWWALAGALIVVMLGAGRVAYGRPRGYWLQTVVPLLVLPIIQLLRAADGDSQSGFSPLVLLPVVWFALYGRRRDVYVAIVGAALGLFGPLLFIGAPQYPSRGWRGAALVFVLVAMIGPIIHRLVASTRRATHDLAVSEERFRAAFEGAPVGMSLTGASPEDAGQLLRVNRAMARMLGRQVHELIGHSLLEFTHPDDVAISTNAMQVDRPNPEHRFEARFLHRSGRAVWAGVSFSLVLDSQGRPAYFVSQIEDISARRESDQALLDALDQQRAATEQLSSLDQARSDLVSTVSHELRTPLAGVAGYVELLADGDAGPLNVEQQGMLDAVERNLGRLNDIVDDLLNLSRIDGETGLPNAAPVDVGAIIVDAVQTVNIMAAVRGQQVTMDSTLHGVEVIGDAGKLVRVLVNLLGNAVKFTPVDGLVAVRGRVTDAGVVIEVSDTGIGIPESERAKIFERFYRSPNAVDRSISGTGLGLAIAQTITTQHGGTISVSSTPGGGSTFTVVLPLRTGR